MRRINADGENNLCIFVMVIILILLYLSHCHRVGVLSTDRYLLCTNFCCVLEILDILSSMNRGFSNCCVMFVEINYTFVICKIQPTN
jgi:hypothetical protein